MSLTKKQRLILDAILFLIRRGEIPTVREVGALVGLRSSATVSKHLKALEAEKLIKTSGKSRGIRIIDRELLETLLEEGEAPPPPEFTAPDADEDPAEQAILREQVLKIHFAGPDQARRSLGIRPGGIRVEGVIAAGPPCETRPEAFRPFAGEAPLSLAIDPRLFGAGGEIFALRVEGDSMVDVGIFDGDYAIVRRQREVEDGEIAVVLVDGEATLKRWHHVRRGEPRNHLDAALSTGGSHDRNSVSALQPSTSSARQNADDNEEYREIVRLVPASDNYDPIEITEVDRKEVIVFGKYVGLVRGAIL
ncbi:MAG: hypothetical protein JXA90_00415 [Planctomycetes bacterium]|nr:hypothetical protein [Planctomycetota bacterium]